MSAWLCIGVSSHLSAENESAISPAVSSSSANFVVEVVQHKQERELRFVSLAEQNMLRFHRFDEFGLLLYFQIKELCLYICVLLVFPAPPVACCVLA